MTLARAKSLSWVELACGVAATAVGFLDDRNALIDQALAATYSIGRSHTIHPQPSLLKTPS